jgi:Type IV conjugative transfer system lipoprotein (TraV)
VLTRILAVLLISVLFQGCSGLTRAESLRMLDERAEYGNNPVEKEPRLKEAGLDGFKTSPVPVRTRPRVAAIWIHPHETGNHDYFWGGWISVVVEQDQWVLTKPGRVPDAPVFSEVPGTSRKSKKPSR